MGSQHHIDDHHNMFKYIITGSHGGAWYDYRTDEHHMINHIITGSHGGAWYDYRTDEHHMINHIITGSQGRSMIWLQNRWASYDQSYNHRITGEEHDML
jgi:hypothetical protein